jgi:tetratricopeptide (TPR) repeat protein
LIGLALALTGLLVLAIILALATRTTGPTSPTTGASIAPPDPRPLDQRMFAYQQQPDVAQAIARMYAGDTNAAIAPLQARARANPRDGLAPYFLGTVYRAGHRLGPAMEQFATALRLEPALAEDSTLATAAVEALADSGAARAAEALFHGPLSQSHTAARAVADEAIHGSSPAARASALDIADSMQSLLTPLDRARIRLRIARNCDELRAALGGLESMGEGTPRDEAAAVREGACDMLRMGNRRESCLDAHRRH